MRPLARLPRPSLRPRPRPQPGDCATWTPLDESIMQYLTERQELAHAVRRGQLEDRAASVLVPGPRLSPENLG